MVPGEGPVVAAVAAAAIASGVYLASESPVLLSTVVIAAGTAANMVSKAALLVQDTTCSQHLDVGLQSCTARRREHIQVKLELDSEPESKKQGGVRP